MLPGIVLGPFWVTPRTPDCLDGEQLEGEGIVLHLGVSFLVDRVILHLFGFADLGHVTLDFTLIAR